MRTSLATSASIDLVTSQVLALAGQIGALSANLVITGPTIPTAEQRTLTWVKTKVIDSQTTPVTTALDGVFTYIGGTYNSWYMRLPWTINELGLFGTATVTPGWVTSTASGLPTVTGYSWRAFDGNGYTIIDGKAYRRYDQV